MLISRLPPIDDLIRMTEHHTLEEIGRFFGVTRQRVHYMLSQSDVYLEKKQKEREALEDRDIEIRHLFAEGWKSQELADKYSLSLKRIYAITQGVKYTPVIGCDKCKTEHYAKGYCKSCYDKRVRMSKP